MESEYGIGPFMLTMQPHFGCIEIKLLTLLDESAKCGIIEGLENVALEML